MFNFLTLLHLHKTDISVYLKKWEIKLFKDELKKNDGEKPGSEPSLEDLKNIFEEREETSSSTSSSSSSSEDGDVYKEAYEVILTRWSKKQIAGLALDLPKKYCCISEAE